MKRIISIFLSLSMIITAFSGCKDKEVDRTKSAIYTQNFEITTGMLTYYFNAQYLGFINAYKDNLESIGLDTSLPLSEQECSLNGSNWYDYFMDIAIDKLTQCLIISEQASIDGKKLNASEKEKVKDVENTIKADSEKNNLSTEDYIKKTFGKGVTLNDIIKCSEMENLTTKYYNNFIKDLDTDQTDMEKYYDQHKKSYSKIDYMFFSLPITDTDELEINKIYDIALKLGESKSEKDFKNGVEEYVEKYLETEYPNYSDEKISEKVIEALNGLTYSSVSYDSSSEAARWAFDDNRKEGDTTVIKNEEQNSYDVYYLLASPYREEYKLTTIRQILIDPADYKTKNAAKEQANKLLDQLTAENFSENVFKNLCSEYSADTDTATNGGLYKDLVKGSFKDADEIEEWVFDAERKVSDSTVIKTKNYGYHIIYIEEQGDPIWLDISREDFENSQFEEYILDLSDNFMVYENNNIIYKINEVSFSDNAV